MYTDELSDVQAYVHAAEASGNYVEPATTASKSIIYNQPFWGAQVTCMATFISIIFDCIRVLACFLFLLHKEIGCLQQIKHENGFGLLQPNL